MKNIIFLSHIEEEQEIALLFKKAIEQEFKTVEVFSFSDNLSVQAGDPLLKKVEKATINCLCAIFLFSPTSYKKPWINFELGAMWMRNLLLDEENQIPIIPVCINGASMERLNIPLTGLIAKSASNSNHVKDIFARLQRTVEPGKENYSYSGDLATQVSKSEVPTLVEELHHINLSVSNLEGSIHFYTEILKLRLITRLPFEFFGNWFGLSSGQHLHLVLNAKAPFRKRILPIKGDVKTPPDEHFAFKVSKETLEEIELKLISGHHEYVRQPYPLVGVFQLYALDPDGYMIELTAFESDQQRIEYLEKPVLQQP